MLKACRVSLRYRAGKRGSLFRGAGPGESVAGGRGRPSIANSEDPPSIQRHTMKSHRRAGLQEEKQCIVLQVSA